ncbi:RES family NAD+ phosphorylase [Methylobacterium organophilum]
MSKRCAPASMPEPGSRLVLWRAYVPRWAHDPLSGAGAARFGGRWNRIGQPCLYAARELSTAWAEYNQGFVQHPATIAQLILKGARLADLTAPDGLRGLGLPDDLHRAEWRADLDAGRLPETHRAAERLLEAGFHGLIYPSFMSRGGTCIALWRWNGEEGPRLSVIDPEGRLPKTDAPWL